MSRLSSNYEKVALGCALVLAAGFTFMGYQKLSSVDQDFGKDLIGKGSNNSAVKNADLIPKALASLKLNRDWAQALDGERPVDLFTGIPLFLSKAAPEKEIDLLKDEPVHAPIPNTWWIENRLDPGFSDSPTRDPDLDGFTNLEEFLGITDPNSAKQFPPLIAKLLYVKDESLAWVIRPGYGSNGSFPFSYGDAKNGENKTGAADMIAANGMFFAKGVMANRFKLLGFEVRKVMNKKINIEVEETIVKIEDQRPNKVGKVYEIPSPLSEQRKNDHVNYDRTAVLSLEALGLNGKQFKVEENTAFALPPTSPTKDYVAKIVTPDKVTVEYTAPTGEKKMIELSKGILPTVVR